MKKHLVLGALAVLSLAACTKSEVVELNKGNEISLTAVTGKNLTKAADGYCNSAMPADFAVWAATAGKKYFEAQTYTRDASTNTYKSTNARYWPATAVDFFAAKNYKGTGDTPATATLDATAGSSKLTVSNFEVTKTVGNQTDFIYAVNKGVSKPTSGNAAALNFRHALSQIEFQAKNQNAGIHVEISEVTIKNVCSKGNFSVSAATTGNYQQHIHDEAADNPTREGRCSWTLPSPLNTTDCADYTISFSPAVDVKNNGSADLSVIDVTGEYNARTMYLIPQAVANIWNGTDALASTDAYFLLTAKIYNVAGTAVDKDKDVVLHDGKIAVPIPASTTWEDGLRYVYTFNFTTTGTGGVDPGTGKPVLTPIELTVTVDDFVDAGNTNVEVK